MGTIRPVALLVVGMLAAGACGTRVDREAYYARLEAGGPAATGEAYAPPPGAAARPGDPLPSPRASSVTTRAATGTTGIRPSGPAATTTSTAPARVAATGGSGLSTEVVGNVIDVGIHVPETGAAPLPTDWKDVLDVVVAHLNQNPVHGRRLHFRVEDDGYDASRALAACRKLADDNVLFAIGHTAPGAEDACAGFFHGRGVPYLMRGNMEKVLSGRPLAWFGTTPDDVQGRLLGDYVLNRLGGRTRKSAVVFENDQVAARDGFAGRLRDGGGQVALVEEVNSRQSDFSAVVQKLAQSGAELVFLSLPPVAAIKIAVQAQSQGYHPTWLGGGSYWNYNMAVEAAGMALDGAISFSPWPSVDSADAAEYRAVYQKARPGKEPPDIGLIIWGWANLARAALEKVGPALSRASLVDALGNLSFTPPYWNPVRYRPDDRRGTASVAVFRADGQARRWRQVSGFTDRF
jgi:ABC-type branched-subunit amino acid transport system substrate-binding protein